MASPSLRAVTTGPTLPPNYDDVLSPTSAQMMRELIQTSPVETQPFSELQSPHSFGSGSRTDLSPLSGAVSPGSAAADFDWALPTPEGDYMGDAHVFASLATPGDNFREVKREQSVGGMADMAGQMSLDDQRALDSVEQWLLAASASALASNTNGQSIMDYAMSPNAGYMGDYEENYAVPALDPSFGSEGQSIQRKQSPHQQLPYAVPGPLPGTYTLLTTSMDAYGQLAATEDMFEQGRYPQASYFSQPDSQPMSSAAAEMSDFQQLLDFAQMQGSVQAIPPYSYAETDRQPVRASTMPYIPNYQLPQQTQYPPTIPRTRHRSVSPRPVSRMGSDSFHMGAAPVSRHPSDSFLRVSPQNTSRDHAAPYPLPHAHAESFSTLRRTITGDQGTLQLEIDHLVDNDPADLQSVASGSVAGTENPELAAFLNLHNSLYSRARAKSEPDLALFSNIPTPIRTPSPVYSNHSGYSPQPHALPFPVDSLGLLPPSQQFQQRRNSAPALPTARHVCAICGKEFTRRYNLKGHERAHRGEKPFECAECGASFTRQNDLRRHMKVHGPLHPCDTCGEDFGTVKKLKEHQAGGCA